MGKGPDQGDYETPTADNSSSAEVWPTEPDEAPSSVPADTGATTVVPEGPGDVGQLPTTSGPDAATTAVAVVGAVALIGAGLALAWRRRRPHW